MASGYTTTGSLADSLPTVLHEARLVREFEGVMPQLVDKQTLPEGTGINWNEVSYAALTAQEVTETTVLNNPQQISDTLFTVTPIITQIQTFITDRVRQRITKNGFALLGQLAQNAIQRKKDTDGLTMLDGFSTSLCGAATTLSSGHIAAGATRITGNTTEPGVPPIRCVLHPYGIKDLFDELVAGVGTSPVPEGPTATVFSNGFKLPVAGAEVYADGNITIDSDADAKGGIFAMKGLLIVQGHAPRAETRREPHIGGGGDSVFLSDEWAYGERQDVWGCELYHDATAPTS